MSEPPAPQNPLDPPPPLDYAAPPGRSEGIRFILQIAIAIGLTILALAVTITPYFIFPGLSDSPSYLLIFPGLAITALIFAAIRGGARSFLAGVLGIVLTIVGLMLLAFGICLAMLH